MSYKEFYSDYQKGNLGNCLFLHGAEDFLIDWAVESIVNKNLDDESKELDYQELNGETCAVSDIISSARAYSMFSEKRVVVVRNYIPLYKKQGEEAELNAILELAESDNDSCILIFAVDADKSANINAYGKKLMKACTTYEFTALDKGELQGFISKRVREAGNMMGRREMDYLIDLSGYYNRGSAYHLKDLHNDLLRINTACNGEQISISLIEELMVGEDDRYVFNLIDSMMSDDKRTTMSLLTAIVCDDESAMKSIGLITKQFEIMFDALDLESQGLSIAQMAKATGVNEYRFKKAYQSARKFSRSQMKDKLMSLYNIDRDVKSGNITAEDGIKLFAMNV